MFSQIQFLKINEKCKIFGAETKWIYNKIEWN